MGLICYGIREKVLARLYIYLSVRNEKYVNNKLIHFVQDALKFITIDASEVPAHEKKLKTLLSTTEDTVQNSETALQAGNSLSLKNSNYKKEEITASSSIIKAESDKKVVIDVDPKYLPKHAHRKELYKDKADKTKKIASKLKSTQTQDLSVAATITLGFTHPFITAEKDNRKCPMDDFLIILSCQEHTKAKYLIAIPYDICSQERFTSLKLKFISKILVGNMSHEKDSNSTASFLVVKEIGRMKRGVARLYIDKANEIRLPDHPPVLLATLFSPNPHTASGSVKLSIIPQASDEMIAKL